MESARWIQTWNLAVRSRTQVTNKQIRNIIWIKLCSNLQDITDPELKPQDTEASIWSQTKKNNPPLILIQPQVQRLINDPFDPLTHFSIQYQKSIHSKIQTL